MTNVTNPQEATTNNDYFNGVLYTRVRINEIKLIQPKSKKAKQYCAINATILGTDAENKKTYTNIDLVVKGQANKKLLWKFNEQWPANRYERDDVQWLADVNIGSIGHCGFEKRNGDAGATLKGRLINIRSLKIGKDVVFGEMDSGVTNPMFASPAYINLVDNKKGYAKACLLEGKIGEHDHQNINLFYNDINVFAELEAQGLCPKGYKHRETNAKIFAILELSKIEAIGYKKGEEFLSYLSGKLEKVRYLKANDEVMTKPQKFVEGFSNPNLATA